MIDAQKFLKDDLPPLDLAACLKTIGCAKKARRDADGALPFLLDSLSIFPCSGRLLVGHVQDDLARVQDHFNCNNSAFFFIEMANSIFN